MGLGWEWGWKLLGEVSTEVIGMSELSEQKIMEKS